MHEVMAAVFNTLMHTPHDFLGGFALFGAVLVLDLIEPALRFRQSRFFFAEETRVLDELTIG